jgi:hypothetical protein
MRAGLSDNLSCCTQLWEIPQQKWNGAPLVEGRVEQYELPHIAVALIFRFIISAHVLGSPRDYSSRVMLHAPLSSPGVGLAAHAIAANRVF